jgi:hypothetical protein
MVTRNYGIQDLPSYSRLFQIESRGDSGAGDIEDHHAILKLHELKPHNLATHSIHQHEEAIYYDLSSVPK